MYCRSCGKEMSDRAIVCSGCGQAVDEVPGATRSSGKSWSLPIMLCLFFMALFVPPAGLVFGIMGLRDEGKKAQGAMLTTMSIFLMIFVALLLIGF